MQRMGSERHEGTPQGGPLLPEVVGVGASQEDARGVAANSRRWWRNSRLLLNRIMPIVYDCLAKRGRPCMREGIGQMVILPGRPYHDLR